MTAFKHYAFNDLSSKTNSVKLKRKRMPSKMAHEQINNSDRDSLEIVISDSGNGSENSSAYNSYGRRKRQNISIRSSSSTVFVGSDQDVNTTSPKSDSSQLELHLSAPTNDQVLRRKRLPAANNSSYIHGHLPSPMPLRKRTPALLLNQDFSGTPTGGAYQSIPTKPGSNRMRKRIPIKSFRVIDDSSLKSNESTTGSGDYSYSQFSARRKRTHPIMNDGVWKDKWDAGTNIVSDSSESERKRKRIKTLRQNEEPVFGSYALSDDKINKSGKGSKGSKGGNNSHKTIDENEMSKSGKDSKGSHSYNTYNGGISSAKSLKDYSNKSKRDRSAKSGKDSFPISGLAISSSIDRKRTREPSNK